MTLDNVSIMQVTVEKEDGTSLTYNGVDRVTHVDSGDSDFITLEYYTPSSEYFPEETYLADPEQLTDDTRKTIDVENAQIKEVRPTATVN